MPGGNFQLCSGGRERTVAAMHPFFPCFTEPQRAQLLLWPDDGGELFVQ